MKIFRLDVASLRRALADGWALAGATRGVSSAYAAVFRLAGLLIVGTLLAQGLTPFVVVAAGVFMLVGPAILACFFGIARAHEAGESVRFPAFFPG